MVYFFGLMLFILFICICISIPIKIAERRGITGNNLVLIKVLSWCGIFNGLTIFIAFVLSLSLSPDKK